MSKRRIQQGIQSIEVGHDLLAALAAGSHPLTLKELSEKTGMPAPKAHRYLVSYARMGLVEQQLEDGRYDLGPFALQLGLAALGRMEPVNVASKALGALAEEINQTVALAVWANHGPTIVRWMNVDSPVSATLRVGSVMPLSRSATGMLFLAYLPPARWSALLQAELADNARKRLQPQSLAAVTNRIKTVRREGCACTRKFIVGITGVSAPVFDSDGALALALVALGHSEAFDRQLDQIKRALLHRAREISHRLGAPGLTQAEGTAGSATGR